MSKSDKNVGYYESILQLRDVSPKIVEFVQNEIKKAQVKVAKTIPLKSGLDLYLPENTWAKSLGKKLQEFGGHLEITATLHTRKDDQDLYRLTILFRGVPFCKGDKVTHQGEKYEVIHMGNDLLLQHHENKKKIHVKWKEASRISLDI